MEVIGSDVDVCLEIHSKMALNVPQVSGVAFCKKDVNSVTFASKRVCMCVKTGLIT